MQLLCQEKAYRHHGFWAEEKMNCNPEMTIIPNHRRKVGNSSSP
jgi:hypothetical protein